MLQLQKGDLTRGHTVQIPRTRDYHQFFPKLGRWMLLARFANPNANQFGRSWLPCKAAAVAASEPSSIKCLSFNYAKSIWCYYNSTMISFRQCLGGYKGIDIIIVNREVYQVVKKIRKQMLFVTQITKHFSPIQGCCWAEVHGTVTWDTDRGTWKKCGWVMWCGWEYRWLVGICYLTISDMNEQKRVVDQNE